MMEKSPGASIRYWLERYRARFMEEKRENSELRRLNNPENWSWEEGIERMKIWLDSHYPKERYDESCHDPGSVFVVAVRDAFDRLEGHDERDE